MKTAEEEVLQNGKRIEMEDSFQTKIYTKRLFQNEYCVNKIMILYSYVTLWY